MEKFPTVSKSQVVLLRAEKATGHVLDENFDLATSDDQKVYTVFDSLKEGLDTCRNILISNQEIECTLFGSDRKMLFYLCSLKDYEEKISEK